MAEAKSEIAGAVLPTSKQQAMLMLEAAYLSMDMGKWDHARDILTGAAALMPKSEVPQLALGTLEFNQGHFEKALQSFRSAQRLSPKAALPRAHSGEALIQLNKAAEAQKELVAAYEADPKAESAKFALDLLVLLGVREFNNGHVDKGQAALKAVLDRNAKHALAHAHMGQVLYVQGKVDDAKAALKQAVELDGGGDAGKFAKYTLDAIAKGEKPAAKPGKAK